MEKTEKHLLLANIGREIAEKIKVIYPEIYGSITFNFKGGFYCNWKVDERGKDISNRNN